MDYETPDGSQFSLREVWCGGRDEDDASPKSAYTTISATVNGQAFFGRLDKRVDNLDEGDVLSSLEPVPPEAIYPTFDKSFTEAPAFDPSKHYLKAPSFEWEDCQHGVTFVADCMLKEIQALERLKQHPHPNIVTYHGCVVKDGRVTHICLEKCESNAIEYFERTTRSQEDVTKFVYDLEAGILFLHSLGLAHNDISPENVCVTNDEAVIVDFDSCIPFGQRLMKGASTAYDDEDCPVSAAQNDFRGLGELEAILLKLRR